MYVANDWGLVRIIHDGSPFDKQYDIIVQTKNDDGEWVFFDGFNSLSNDYAFASANQSASRAIKMMAEKSANSFS